MEPGRKLKENASPVGRILEAATEEFATNGYFGARTQAIADAAGINKAMLHYYFRSKENLYSQVIKVAFRKILGQVGKAWLEKGSLESGLENVVDSYMDNYQQNPGFLKIILREFVDGGVRFKKTFRDLKGGEFLPSGMTPADLVNRVAEELGLNAAEAVHLVINLIGMCAISFISPLLLDSILHFDVEDSHNYLKDRRASIKAMLLTYVGTLTAHPEED